MPLCKPKRLPAPTEQAEELDACLQALLSPACVPGIPGTPPLLATLPLVAQANLLLLLKAVPSRFAAAQRAAVLDSLCGLSDSGLLSCLAADVQASSCDQAGGGAERLSPSPCPAFLLGPPAPCFPWAPALAEATLPAQRRAAAGQRQRAGGDRNAAVAADGGSGPAKRPCLAASEAADPNGTPAASADAELATAAATVLAVISGSGGGRATQSALPAECRAALDVVLARAAVCGARALQLAGLDGLADDALLLQLLAESVSPASSFAVCSAACGGMLLPRLRRLDGPAPRDLAAAVEHLGALKGPDAPTCCECGMRGADLLCIPALLGLVSALSQSTLFPLPPAPTL